MQFLYRQFPYRQLPFVFLCLLAVAMAGCKSDPYCQQAISNLRSEKIQLENQYFALKNQHDSEMRRLGQPLPDPVNSPAPGGFIEEYIPESGPGVSMMPHQPLLEGQVTGNGLKEPAIADVSRYIQSIEVSQLQSGSGESVRLLICPLDERGDVIPVAGDLKVTLVDSISGASMASYQFDRNQVEDLVEDRNGQVPGIHLSLPQLTNSPASQNMTCRLQFRTATQRILSSQTPVVLASGSVGAKTTIQSTPKRSVSRPGIAEISDTPPLNDVLVEIGDELNLDTLGNSPSPGVARPSWTPGR